MFFSCVEMTENVLMWCGVCVGRIQYKIEFTNSLELKNEKFRVSEIVCGMMYLLVQLKFQFIWLEDSQRPLLLLELRDVLQKGFDLQFNLLRVDLKSTVQSSH